MAAVGRKGPLVIRVGPRPLRSEKQYFADRQLQGGFGPESANGLNRCRGSGLVLGSLAEVNHPDRLNSGVHRIAELKSAEIWGQLVRLSPIPDLQI